MKRTKRDEFNESPWLDKDSRMLRVVRNYRGLTQKEFATELGISISTYRKYEKGKGNISRKVQWYIEHKYSLDIKATRVTEIRENVPIASISKLNNRNVQSGNYWSRIINCRETLGQDFENFASEKFTELGNKIQRMRATVSFTATLTYLFRILANEFDISLLASRGDVDLLLIFSAITFLILMPFEIYDYIRFYRWRLKPRITT